MSLQLLFLLTITCLKVLCCNSFLYQRGGCTCSQRVDRLIRLNRAHRHRTQSVISPSPPYFCSSNQVDQEDTMTNSNKEKIDWIIRPTTSEDADSINSLLKVCYETLLPHDYDSDVLEKALPLITQARPELLTCGTWYLVEHPDTGVVVGCGGWADSPTKTTETNVHLRHFATHPDYLRMGIARGIWDRIRTDIIAKMGPDTDLEVYSTLTAEPFYASLSFEPTETLQLPLRPDCNFPSVLMKRSGKSLEL